MIQLHSAGRTVDGYTSNRMEWLAAKHGYDEALSADNAPRDWYENIVSALEQFDSEEIARREQLQQVSLVNQGITFTVYGREEGVERVFPFDFVPRIISGSEWNSVEAGLVQRLEAINLFLADIYSDQKCLRDGVIPP